MADLAVTSTKIGVVFPLKAEIHTGIAAAAITAGQAVYLDANGNYDLADASVAGTASARGLALQNAGAGQAFNLLKRGHVEGFTITQAYDALIYVSDTTGALADAAGLVSRLVGSVVPMSDKDRSKVLFLDFPWNE